MTRRVFRLSEDVQEAPRDQVETILCCHGIQIWYLRLWSDDPFDLRYKIDEYLADRTE